MFLLYEYIRDIYNFCIWMEMNSMDSRKPIGVFDSGVGGLSVAREIFRHLPEEQIVYFGDTLHVPYGPRSAEELIDFGDQISEFLVNKGVKMIVIACNTSSSVSLEYLTNKYSVPFVDVINPSIDVAINTSKKKKIGIIATEATIKSEAHKNLLLKRDPEISVYTSACPKFVPLVEKGLVEGEEVENIAREYLMPLVEKGIDTLILGCTHYPFLEKTIKKIVGEGITIIDPALETVKNAKEKLTEIDLLSKEKNKKHQYFVTSNPTNFLQTAQKFVHNKITTVEKVNL